jgi:ABC-type transport system involved in multi-copper enzyme maturation permease subunit
VITRAIVANTLRDLVRRKMIWFFLLILLGLGGCSALSVHSMDERRALSIGDKEAREMMASARDMMVQMVVSSVALGGLLLAIILGSSTLTVEVESRSVHTVLAKGVSRTRFLLAKLGAASLVLLTYHAMALPIMVWAMARADVVLEPRIAIALLQSTLSSLVWMSVAFAFSTGGGAIRAATLTLALYVPAIFASVVQDSPRWDWFGRIVDWPLPEWSLLQGVSTALVASPLTGHKAWWGIAHGLDYVVLMVLLAAWLFRRRELA